MFVNFIYGKFELDINVSHQQGLPIRIPWNQQLNSLSTENTQIFKTKVSRQLIIHISIQITQCWQLQHLDEIQNIPYFEITYFGYTKGFVFETHFY